MSPHARRHGILIVLLSTLFTAFAPAARAIVEFTVYTASDPNSWGGVPVGQLVYANGLFFGVMRDGGARQSGLIYKLSVIQYTTAYTIVHQFTGGTNDGSTPTSGLIIGKDNRLYGTTSSGGQFGQGTLYSLKSDGTDYRVVYNFGAFPGDGKDPESPPTQLADGTLCGTTAGGGQASGNSIAQGTVYVINTDGSGYHVIHTFLGTDGASPNTPVTECNGRILGTTRSPPIIYALAKDGSSFSIVHEFLFTKGDFLSSPLLLRSDGYLYGTELGGAVGDCIYKLKPDGTGLASVYAFSTGPWAGIANPEPEGALLQGADGRLYGTTKYGAPLGCVYAVQPDGSGFQIVYAFPTAVAAGSGPVDGVAQNWDGRLLGVTRSGGTQNLGVIFAATGGVPKIINSPDPAIVGFYYSFEPKTDNYADRFTISGLPPNLTFDPYYGFFEGPAPPAGTYNITLTASNDWGSSTRNFTLEVEVYDRVAIATQPSSVSVAAGSSATFTVVATGSPPLTYQWYSSAGAISGATSPTYTLASTSASDAGSYYVLVKNMVDTVYSQSAYLTLAAASPNAPTITCQPASQTVASGGTAVFNCTVGADPGVQNINTASSTTYQWLYNGIALTDGTSGSRTVAGSKTSLLLVTGVGANQEGIYTCLVKNASATVMSLPATLNTATNTVSPGRLINLSSRVAAGKDAKVMIGGVVIGGGTDSTLPVLIRASGPALAKPPFSIDGTLSDPEIDIHSSIGGADAVIAKNIGWKGDPAIAATANAVGAFPWTDETSADSALFAKFSGKAYTAVVSGASPDASDTGIVLSEIYDASDPTQYVAGKSLRLLNISARANVGVGSNIVIAGFVITGDTAVTVLIRAAGPALGTSPFNLSGVLADPRIDLHTTVGGKDQIIATNSGWGGDVATAAAAKSVGAFTWSDPKSADSAILITLPPGAYSALVSGKSGDSGIALTEVYEVP